MRNVAVAIALMLGLNGAAAAPLCPGGETAVASCFDVHGRIQAWNGNPTFRIWRIGTKRVLGVHDDAVLPSNLKQAFGGHAFGKHVVADFHVCPLTKQRKGWMQTVCILSVSRVVVTKAD